MSSPPKLQRERKRKGLCVGCGGKPKAGRLRCESCLKRQREYDKTYRDSLKGAATVEPQCKMPGGKMRADHVFDEDGLCDCSARKMEFAPRPPLRPEIVKAAAPRRASAPTKPAAPPAVAPAKPVLAPKPRAKRQPPAKVEKRVEDTALHAMIAKLEEQRAGIDAAIVTLRKLEEWWPR